MLRPVDGIRRGGFRVCAPAGSAAIVAMMESRTSDAESDIKALLLSIYCAAQRCAAQGLYRHLRK